MSKIDELIAKLCPDGVEYRELGSLLSYEQPTKYLVSSTAYSDDYETPVLTAGKTFILGYTNDEEGFYPSSPEAPVIIFDDFTTDFKWVDFPFKAKSSAMKMLHANGPQWNLRYVFHAMQTLSFVPQGHKRHWIGVYSHLEIPVPPMEIQKEIVKVLDSFITLEAELEAELEARKAQYGYYRNQLLSIVSLEQMDDDDVPIRQLKDVADIGGGHTPPKSDSSNYDNGCIPWVTSKDVKEPHLSTTGIAISKSGARSLTLYPRDSIVVVLRSGILKRHFPVAMLDVPMTVNQDIKAVTVRDEDRLLPRFLFHCIDSQGNKILAASHRAGGTVDSVPLDDFKRVQIPVPSLATQQKVVDILDRFDALTTSLTDGLPAEIKARCQQYNHYRDQLLSLPRKSS